MANSMRKIFLSRYSANLELYIYGNYPKINTFRNGRCTQAWTTIVLLLRIATLSIFGSIKFDDNPFFGMATVIFCTQGIIAILITHTAKLKLTIMQIFLFPSTNH